MNPVRETPSPVSLAAALGIVLAAGVALTVIRREKPQSAEDRAFWEENARKVTRGWNEGVKAGMAVGQERARNRHDGIPSRDIAKLAAAKREEAGLTDESEANSFDRGFRFGYYKGFEAPDAEEP